MPLPPFPVPSPLHRRQSPSKDHHHNRPSEEEHPVLHEVRSSSGRIITTALPTMTPGMDHALDHDGEQHYRFPKGKALREMIILWRIEPAPASPAPSTKANSFMLRTSIPMASAATSSSRI